MVKPLHSDDLRALATRLIRKADEPAVRLRLLRAVLGVPAGDPRVLAAGEALVESPHVVGLAAEQRADGGWGRLHSCDSASKGRVPTTEWAVERALALGLDAQSDLLRRAAEHLASVLAGDALPTDRPEKNDRWSTGLQLFAAATLSQIDSRHKAIDDTWSLWHEIARRTFARGRYDETCEAEAHQALTGASVRGSYLVLSNRYALTLLGARSEEVERTLQHRLLDWLGDRPTGIGYLGMPLASPGEPVSGGAIESWLRSHEILSRFAVWPERASGVTDWLMAHRRADGFWDLGPRAASSPWLPLSADWRKKDARAIDWTTRVLSLLVERNRRSFQKPDVG